MSEKEHSKKHADHESHAHAKSSHKQHETVKHEHENHEHQHAHKSRAKRSKGTNWTAVAIGVVALIIIAYLLFRGPAVPQTKGQTIEVPDGDYGTAKLDFYVMSKCPYGTQVENAVAPVLEELGDSVDFTVNFIASEGASGQFNSLHGPAEVYGDKLHLCVQEHYPEQLIKFITCQNEKIQDIKGTIDSCAEKVGIDATKIKECADGQEGTDLLSASIKASQAVQASGSPTMYLNGNPYQGGRDAASFKKALCTQLDNHPACEGLPACSTNADCTAESGKIGTCENAGKKDSKCTYMEDAKVTLTVVNVPDCTECDPTQLLNVLEGVFLNMEVEQVDATTAEGKSMVQKYSLEKAPAFIFSSGLTETAAWKNNQKIQGAFRQVDGSYVMIDEASGSSYLIDEKKRKEMEEKIGVKKGDNRPQIDFYVMSYCPYGNIAEEGIEPVYRLLADKADFNAHYVIYSDYASGYPQYCLDEDNKYCSMHGAQEVSQDVREMCVHKYLGTDKMFDFMLAMNKKCSAQNADTCWEKVAEDLGLDTEKIKTCEKDEGLQMLENEAELNKLLGVRGSPTVFVDGAPYQGGRDPASYAAALCAAFEDAPAECDDLSSLGGGASASTTAAAAGGCGA